MPLFCTVVHHSTPYVVYRSAADLWQWRQAQKTYVQMHPRMTSRLRKANGCMGVDQVAAVVVCGDMQGSLGTTLVLL
jgi:hypothetical protein